MEWTNEKRLELIESVSSSAIYQFSHKTIDYAQLFEAFDLIHKLSAYTENFLNNNLKRFKDYLPESEV